MGLVIHGRREHVTHDRGGPWKVNTPPPLKPPLIHLQVPPFTCQAPPFTPSHPHSLVRPSIHLPGNFVLVRAGHAEPVVQCRPQVVEDLEAPQPLG